MFVLFAGLTWKGALPSLPALDMMPHKLLKTKVSVQGFKSNTYSGLAEHFKSHRGNVLKNPVFIATEVISYF